MTFRALTTAVALALLIAACSGSDDSNGDEGDTTTGTQSAEPGAVAELPDGTAVITQGALVIDGDTTRLCEVLMESFPPQCGEGSVVLGDLQTDLVGIIL